MTIIPDLSTLTFALFGGIVPALIWLVFWLKEDARRPEPKRLIFGAFVTGMLGVPLALFLEKGAHSVLEQGPLLIILWAVIEELLKYGGAYFIAFRKWCVDGTKCVDEPIDPMIYMITVALGFSALENTLFLINPLTHGDALGGFVTGNLRFIGAMVLHVLASASIGLAMGLSFYKSPHAKRIYLGVGIFTAIALHVLFNLSIIISKGENIFIIFGFLWVAALFLLLMFEKVKRV